ncbi:MAG: heat-inducible transcriptional repressor [Thermodesulfobacteriota bacterium]|nr:heat-inducible transcriptional repressor [Thermodesulfobacteriota bacterium]
MHGLEKRSEKILEVLVAEYIATGDPVGSRTLSKIKDIGLSAASIRNIMSDLTESGYITQPHVSAGRVPTDQGYRLYVNGLPGVHETDQNKYSEIESLIKSVGPDVRDLLRQSSLVLAGFSKQAGVVSSGPVVQQTFKTIEFIKVATERILVILISASGFVQTKTIYDEDDIDQHTLETYGRMLTDMLKDLDLHQARERIERELAQEKTHVNAMLAKTLKLGHMMLSQPESREVFIQGQSNILTEPEFSQVEKLSALLTAFEEKSNLLKILDKTLKADGIQIYIGAEHGLQELDSCSIVAYPIRTTDTVVGSIGVVGPKRMNYHRVVPLVYATARILTNVLSRIIERPS